MGASAVTIYSHQCAECRHYRGGQTCAAFISGIPTAIWDMEHDHTKPFKGDGGITFEPWPDEESEEEE